MQQCCMRMISGPSKFATTIRLKSSAVHQFQHLCVTHTCAYHLCDCTCVACSAHPSCSAEPSEASYKFIPEGFTAKYLQDLDARAEMEAQAERSLNCDPGNENNVQLLSDVQEW